MFYTHAKCCWSWGAFVFTITILTNITSCTAMCNNIMGVTFIARLYKWEDFMKMYPLHSFGPHPLICTNFDHHTPGCLWFQCIWIWTHSVLAILVLKKTWKLILKKTCKLIYFYFFRPCFQHREGMGMGNKDVLDNIWLKLGQQCWWIS